MWSWVSLGVPVAVLAAGLAWMTLRVSSNLDDSMVLSSFIPK